MTCWLVDRHRMCRRLCIATPDRWPWAETDPWRTPSKYSWRSLCTSWTAHRCRTSDREGTTCLCVPSLPYNNHHHTRCRRYPSTRCMRSPVCFLPRTFCSHDSSFAPTPAGTVPSDTLGRAYRAWHYRHAPGRCRRCTRPTWSTMFPNGHFRYEIARSRRPSTPHRTVWCPPC